MFSGSKPRTVLAIGVNLASGRLWATAESVTALNVKAEAWGFDSVWASDHVVIPSKIDDSKYPYGPPGSFNPDSLQNWFEAFGVLSQEEQRVLIDLLARVRQKTLALLDAQGSPVSNLEDD